jgi:hypothetical protein
MRGMRHTLLVTLLVGSLGLCQAQAQTMTSAVSPAPVGESRLPGAGIEKRTERILIEDAGSRIDELRVGGETRSITVQPKGGAPRYQIQPSSGERSWNVLVF